MAQGQSILDDLFRRPANPSIRPIKSIRIKRVLSEPLVIVPGGLVVRSEAYARELVGLTVQNNGRMMATLRAAEDKLRERPEITEARIATDLTGRQVSIQPPSISWRFDTPPMQVIIVQADYSGDAATILIDVKSEAGPRAFFPRRMAGKLRLHYQWMAGWTLTRIEYLDFKEQ